MYGSDARFPRRTRGTTDPDVAAMGRSHRSNRADRRRPQQKTRLAAGSSRNVGSFGLSAYLILPSLYGTCLRTTGSYFLISILPGVFFLFLSVV